MQGRYVAALLDAQEQCGWLPSWSFPSEAGSMIGNHSISLLADAWAKGIRTFDPGKALDAYFHEATNKGPWGPANGREGWKGYFTLGYVPYPEVREATAKTLEYAYDDFCGYALAKMTNNDLYQRVFGRQMYNYRNVFNPDTGFMQGRHKDGSWKEHFDPYEWGGPYTEGNAWHYLWSVFQDPQGLIDLMGGEENFNKKLDSVFQVSNKVNVGTYGGKIHEMTEMQMAEMGQYAHGNQPIQHAIYLYNYSGQPWKAQKHLREVMEKLYSYTENGYPGDEDQGQTSSWYVLSALGFYSVCPGTDQYVIGSPVFEKATINLENGNSFVINAENNSKSNVYIQSGSLNDKPFSRNYIRYKEISEGGKLKFEMGEQPNKQRGTNASDKPFSLSKEIGQISDSLSWTTSEEKFSRNGYELIFINQDPDLDPETKMGLINTFFKVYPELAKDFNPKTLKKVEVKIDTSYNGVAYANDGKVTISSKWLHKMPKDLDVITHEVMHIVQSYPNGSGPGWLTEGIADYVRSEYGLTNKEGGWSLPDFEKKSHYTNSYRVTARFLGWVVKNYDEDLVFKLDRNLRNNTYTSKLWEEYTGNSLDKLWSLYSGAQEDNVR